MARRQSGFTLLETAFALVLVGLLFATVLKGYTMVHQAKLRKITKMVEDVRSAANLFYREYGRLPGDGQGQVSSRDGWIKVSEIQQFIKELIDNRYMSGQADLTNSPPQSWPHPLGGYVWVQYVDSGASPQPWKDNFIVISGLTADGEDQKQLNDVFDGDNGDLTNGRVKKSGSYLIIAL